MSRINLVQGNNEKDKSVEAYTSKALNIRMIVKKADKSHIQMTEVPKAYFTTIKSITGLDMTFYSNLL